MSGSSVGRQLGSFSFAGIFLFGNFFQTCCRYLFCLNHRMILSLFLVGFYNQSLLSSLAVNSYIISCLFLRNVCCDFFLSGVPKFCFYAEQIFGNLSVNKFFSWELFSRFIPSAAQLRCQITLFYNVEISLVLVEIRFIDTYVQLVGGVGFICSREAMQGEQRRFLNQNDYFIRQMDQIGELYIYVVINDSD